MNAKNYKRTSQIAASIALMLLLAASFVGQPAARVAAASQTDAIQTIVGNIGNNAIEIDDLDNNPNTTPDADLQVGPPSGVCPGSPDPDCPLISGFTYIDWANLAPADPGHFVFYDGTGNTDDSFAGSSTNSCLQPDHAAPQKQDILRVYMADNGQYLYVGLVDLNATGDSRHIILFHKNPVTFGEACSGNGQQMYLQLDPGDKLIRVTFQPSQSEPASQVYSLVHTPGNLYIDQATDFADTTLWQPTAQAANFAANLSVLTDPLGGGASIPAGAFGETAFPLSVLGVPPCGASYNVSVITRSSGSGGGASKDYLGGVYNFPSIYATGSLTGSCTNQISYSAQAYFDAAFQEPIPDGQVSYVWTCDGGLSLSGKSGTVSATPGTYNCTVLATLINSPSCNATSGNLSATVLTPLSVTMDTAATNLSCPDIDTAGTGSTWVAHPSGGVPPYHYTWSVTGANAASACGDSASCFVNFAPADYCGTIGVQVQLDDSSACAPVTSNPGSVTKTTAISVTVGP